MLNSLPRGFGTLGKTASQKKYNEGHGSRGREKMLFGAVLLLSCKRGGDSAEGMEVALSWRRSQDITCVGWLNAQGPALSDPSALIECGASTRCCIR